jgi:putative hemolysin
MRRLISRITGFHRIERLLKADPAQDGLTFLTRAAQEFEVDADVKGLELGPVRGAIFFCTHHTGALDLLALYPALAKMAPNLKIIAGFGLLKLKPMAEISIGVHTLSTGRRNHDARTEVTRHLENDGNILVYPAGKVGCVRRGQPVDYAWRTGMAQILKESGQLAFPVYVGAKNGRLYDLIRKRFPKLSLLFFLSALTWRKKTPVPVRIGKRIPHEVFTQFEAIELTDFLRSSTYEMA